MVTIELFLKIGSLRNSRKTLELVCMRSATPKCPCILHHDLVVLPKYF